MKQFNEEDIVEAKEFVKRKHGDQKRKQGTPYYLHPFAVAELLKQYGFSYQYQLVGLFHDLIEDTDVTEEEIKKRTNQEIATAVKLLSKEKGYNMQDYVERISQNEMAKMVKIADRIHNLTETKFASEDFKEKYVQETKKWYVDLAKGTCFETLLNDVLEELIQNLQNKIS